MDGFGVGAAAGYGGEGCAGRKSGGYAVCTADAGERSGGKEELCAASRGEG